MYSRYESLQFDINGFLKHHPKDLLHLKYNTATPLGILALEKLVNVQQNITVGKISIPGIFSFSRQNRVARQPLTTFIHDSTQLRQIWVPYSFAYRGAHILKTSEQYIADGWVEAETIRKQDLPLEGSELELFEEAKRYLMIIGARAIEAEYVVTPPSIPEFLKGRE
jgi:hypothetical protein